MKKNYQKPFTLVVMLKSKSHLLAGSPQGIRTDTYMSSFGTAADNEEGD